MYLMIRLKSKYLSAVYNLDIKSSLKFGERSIIGVYYKIAQYILKKYILKKNYFKINTNLN